MIPEQPPMQADNSCNFDEFTDIIKRLLEAAWGSKWGTFCEAFPNGTTPNQVEMPVITYSLKRMQPGVISRTGNVELKARHRGSFIQEDSSMGPRAIEVYGRVLDCDVIFDVWDTNNTKVNQLAMRFMEFMDMYLGYFKQQGVKEIIWRDFKNETEGGQWRDDVVCRKLAYHVRLEHLFEVPSDIIQKVTGLVSIQKGESDDYINGSIPFDLSE